MWMSYWHDMTSDQTQVFVLPMPSITSSFIRGHHGKVFSAQQPTGSARIEKLQEIIFSVIE